MVLPADLRLLQVFLCILKYLIDNNVSTALVTDQPEWNAQYKDNPN